jgi:hypothetical protein
MDRDSGSDDANRQPLHYREWLARIIDKLKHLPPDAQQQMLKEPVPVPLTQLMVLLDRAARFEHLVNYGYAVQKNLDALPVGEQNVEQLWDALGNFLKAFNSTLQGADGQRNVPAPAFISVAMGEIANLQQGVPSKHFRLDGEILGNNPYEVQTLVIKASAATFLRLLMDRGREKNQTEMATKVAEALNNGGFEAGHRGMVGKARQTDKTDKGVAPRTVCGWLRDAEAGRAPFSDIYRKNLTAYRERCRPDEIETELASLTNEIRIRKFLPRNRPGL